MKPWWEDMADAAGADFIRDADDMRARVVGKQFDPDPSAAALAIVLLLLALAWGSKR